MTSSLEIKELEILALRSKSGSRILTLETNDNDSGLFYDLYITANLRQTKFFAFTGNLGQISIPDFLNFFQKVGYTKGKLIPAISLSNFWGLFDSELEGVLKIDESNQVYLLLPIEKLETQELLTHVLEDFLSYGNQNRD